MAAAMTNMSPGRLDQRLAVRQPADELDDLADRFNGLLDRLEESRRRNRSFLAQAAHQLRTPLTLVRGESEFGLDRPRSAEEYRTILDRIRAAAGHMSQRVNDLFLLAEADAGDAPLLEDRLELDGLLLECVELMRGRARTTAHPLQFGRVEPAEFTGNEMLLREGVMELVENACRHADKGSSIILDGYPDDQAIRIEVTSRGAPLPDRTVAELPADGGGTEGGLGLSIVRWIARAHGGKLEYLHQDRTNRFAIVLPG
jgi:signal transduction histidine kinase